MIDIYRTLFADIVVCGDVCDSSGVLLVINVQIGESGRTGGIRENMRHIIFRYVITAFSIVWISVTYMV